MKHRIIIENHYLVIARLVLLSAVLPRLHLQVESHLLFQLAVEPISPCVEEQPAPPEKQPQHIALTPHISWNTESLMPMS
jgi:hypothetical protein